MIAKYFSDRKMTVIRGAVLLLMALFARTAKANDVPQSFTLDGKFFSNSEATTALADGNIGVKVQILDQDKVCIIYEESQSVSTLSSKGFFSIQVGSEVGNVKRTTDDAGNSMATIFQNISPISGRAVANGTLCNVGGVAGSRRYVRITITPSTMGGTPRVLNPDLTIDSVPNAVVAERSESIQGLRGSDLLQVNTSGANVLSQSNLENLFTSTARFNALVALVDGTSTSYMRSNSANGAQLPVMAGAPGSPPQGAIWYDSTDAKLKYYTGSATVAVGTGGGSVTSVNLAAPSEFSVTGGPVNTSGTLSLAWSTQTANKVLTSPDGTAGLPSFRTLVEADIPNLTWSKVSSGKPTTLSGYGITDAVQNAGSTPSLQSGLDAGKPAAGTAGRLFIAYDTGKIYRDSGATWDLVSNSYTAPTGTTNHVVKFTGASTMGDSLIVDDGARVTIAADVVSTPGTINSGGTIDLRTSNTHLLKSVGGSVLTLQNMAHGGLYNIIINDTTARTYTFSGCTNSYYKPANGPTTVGTQSIYGVLIYNESGSWNCYITWSTGFQ